MNPANEDWTGRKQLPLRQQRDKPVLKYNVSAPTAPSIPSNRSGVLHSPAEIVNRLTSPVAVTSAFQISPSPTRASPFNQGGQLHTPANGAIHHTLTSTSHRVRSKNPYARPMSAKDLESPDSTGTAVLRKNASTSSLLSSGSNSSSTSSLNKNSPSATPVVNLDNYMQTNTFMRPRSAFKTDATKMTAQSFVADLANTLKIGSTFDHGVFVAGTGIGSYEKYESAVHVSERYTGSPQSEEGAVNHVHKDVQKPAVRFADQAAASTSLSGTASAPASASSRSFTTKEFADRDFRCQDSVGQSKPCSTTASIMSQDVIKSSVVPNTVSSSSSALRPASMGIYSKNCNDSKVGAASSSPSRPASAVGGVRNPNYTPTKPYSEVNSVSHSPVKVSKPQKTEQAKANHPVITNVRPAMQTMAVLPMPPSNTNVRKMPVTNTITGTVYYKKSSKGEELLHDLAKRPRADGASSVPRPPGETRKPPSGRTENATSGYSARTAEKRASTMETNLVKSDAVVSSRIDANDDDDDEWESEDEDDGSDIQLERKANSERMPGDGETDDDEDDDDADDDDDDDVMDGIEDDDGGDSDGSDSYTITSSSSSLRGSGRVKSATKRLSDLSIKGSHSTSRPSTAKARPLSSVSRRSSPDGEAQPALMPSLFSNVPPTVNFVGEGQKVEHLPWDLRKMLKWKMSTITPNVVKSCISRIGFRATKKNHDWLGYWGKHMKALGFKAIKEYQKINHFPGSFQIGRKDRLWKNLSKMQIQFGKRDYGFFPQTFCLPGDLKQLKRVWEDGGNKQKWIIKPPASARGIGIKVIHKWNQIPRKKPVIVQKYLARPYLINDSKFDLRLYVYVSSYDPLRVYIYHDGLVRFASQKYSNSLKSLSNKYMHLTNYSINKKNMEYESNTDESVCQGHKWGLIALWGYLRKRGVNVNSVWESIKDLVIKTIISSEGCVTSMIKANVRRRSCCHELFGFDVMLDENLKPWIIEVNISPSLHSNSPLDINIKGGMIKDLFNIAGFMIPDKSDVTATTSSIPDFIALNQDNIQRASRQAPPNEIVIDKRMWPNNLSSDERGKHAFFCQKHLDELVQSSITDMLTPDDIRLLVESIDEDSRRGNFERVFPTPTTHKYLKHLEAPRYYNLLLDAWVQKFYRMEHRGISLLENYCSKGIHLQNPTDDPKHQWTPPPNPVSRDFRALSAPANAHNKAGYSSTLPKLKKSSSKLKKTAFTGSNSSLSSAGNTPRATAPKSSLVTPGS